MKEIKLKSKPIEGGVVKIKFKWWFVESFFFPYKIKDDALGSSLCLFNSSSYNNFIVLVNVPMFLVWTIVMFV
jgi:hypothetical protein